jgi:hypothetical protein
MSRKALKITDYVEARGALLHCSTSPLSAIAGTR